MLGMPSPAYAEGILLAGFGSGELVAPRGVCDDQRLFRAEIVGDEVVVWDEASVSITGL